MRTALRATISTVVAAGVAATGLLVGVSPVHAHNWDSLPDEAIVHHILPGLKANELWNACNLNQRMNRLCLNPGVWKKHLPFLTGSQLDSLEDLAHRADAHAYQQGEASVGSTLRALITECRNRPIVTFAGNGQRGYNGDGGPATNAHMNGPAAVAIDADGNLYIADIGNHVIRRVDLNGTITTIAGTGQQPNYTGDGGPATSATLHAPHGVAIGFNGDVYIADTLNHVIRRVATNGTITTFAGTGESGYTGDGGPAITAKLRSPAGVAIDPAGNVYIADLHSNVVRRVDAATKVITTIAGNGKPGYSGNGRLAVNARMNGPRGVAIDPAGNLYIVDTFNHAIRRVATNGTITTIAGTGEPGYTGDQGPATKAKLESPAGVAIDPAGNVYIAAANNDAIRRVEASTWVITTIAGTGKPGYNGDGKPSTVAQLESPTGVAIDPVGNLFVADLRNHRVRRFGVGSARSCPTSGLPCAIQ